MTAISAVFPSLKGPVCFHTTAVSIIPFENGFSSSFQPDFVFSGPQSVISMTAGSTCVGHYIFSVAVLTTTKMRTSFSAGAQRVIGAGKKVVLIPKMLYYIKGKAFNQLNQNKIGGEYVAVEKIQADVDLIMILPGLLMLGAAPNRQSRAIMNRSSSRLATAPGWLRSLYIAQEKGSSPSTILSGDGDY